MDGRPDPPPPRRRPARRLISWWIAATAGVYLFGLALAGQGFVTSVLVGWTEGESPLHAAVIDSFERGNILALLLAPFLHTTFFHVFLAGAGVVMAGRLVESLTGGGFTLLCLVLAGAGGALAGRAVDGQLALGATGPYFGLVGVLAALALRRRLEAPILWSISFPLLALAGLFAIFVGEVDDVSHAGHAAAAALGLGMGLGLGPGFRFPRWARWGAALAFAGAAASILPGALRHENARLGEMTVRGLLGFAIPFETYEDPEGRFRIDHPTALEPAEEEGRLVFRQRGGEGTGFAIQIETEGVGDIDTLVAKATERLRRELVAEAEDGSVRVEPEMRLRIGEAEGRRIVARATIDGNPQVRVWLVAVTAEREYVVATGYYEQEAFWGAWVDRMLDSLEIYR